MKKRQNKSQKNRKRQNTVIDYIFTFKYAKFSILCDEDEVDSEEYKKISEALKLAQKIIVIDRSYVMCEENKREKVFIKKDGWMELCRLMTKTHFGDKCTEMEHAVILESYKLLMINYLMQILTDQGFDVVDRVFLEMKDNCKFMAFVEEDTTAEWKTYPGKWQTWE